jgi:hypothetical protein
MKNKLITTALVGSMFGFAISSAVAQTTITGNLDIAYHAVSGKGTDSATNPSYRGFGQEQQINIQNKGKLSNGMDYAAGFSWEIDGDEALGGDSQAAAVATDSSNARQENVFIDLIVNKDLTLSISADHMPNTDVTMTNLVGWGYLGGQGLQNNSSSYPTSLNDSGYGIGFTYNLGPARLTLNHQPNPGKAAGFSDSGHNIEAQQDGDENAKVEGVLRGDFGVKGLDVLIGFQRQDGRTTAAKDENGERFAAKYNFGQVTVAADYIKLEGQDRTFNGSAQSTRAETLKGKSVGIAYALTPAFSIGYTQSKAEVSNATGTSLTNGVEDEKVKMFQAGYNLGAVTVQAQVRDVDNAAGVSTADGKIGSVKLSTKF